MTAGGSNEAQKSDLSGMQASYPAGEQISVVGLQGYYELTDVGRPGHDTDMAACILWLAGPGGVFMNGQTIYLDGGKHIQTCREVDATTK